MAPLPALNLLFNPIIFGRLQDTMAGTMERKIPQSFVGPFITVFWEVPRVQERRRRLLRRRRNGIAGKTF